MYKMQETMEPVLDYYCGGAQWHPLNYHLIRAVVDLLQSLDIFCGFRS
jgi:hypothetical protein